LGGDVPLKGGPELVKIAQMLRESVQVALVGCEHAETINASSLNEKFYAGPSNLIKIGVVDRILPYLEWADVVVFWTNAPHFPRPIFESWLAGRTVVCSRSGAQTELLKRGAAIVARGDTAEDLAVAVRACLDRFNELQGWNKSNRSLAEAIFSEKNFEKIGRVLHELIA
jgi:glycosyltransferase involved in cell wall biosynthesis